MKRFESFDIKNRRSPVLAILKYDDCFYDDGLRQYDFNEALHVYMKNNGYETIVFFSTAKGFFSYEKEMLHNFLEDKEEMQNQMPEYIEEDMFVDDLTGLPTFRFNDDSNQNDNAARRELIKEENYWLEHTIGEQDSQIVDMKKGLKSVDNCAIIIDPSTNEFLSVYFEQLTSCLKLGGVRGANHIIVLVPKNMHLKRIPENMLRSNSAFLSDVYFKEKFLNEINNEKYGFVSYELNDKTTFVVPPPSKHDIKNAFQYWRIVEGAPCRIKWDEIEDIFDQLSVSRGEENEQKLHSLIEWKSLFCGIDEISYDGFKSFGVRKLDDYRTILSELIGMKPFKEWVGKLENKIKIDKDFSLKENHIFLTGNPGTGKTTVAQIIGGCLYELGLLSKKTIVEVGGAELKSDHYGGASIIVNEKVDEAIGGVLFIDEAYSMAHEGNGHGNDPLGREAIDTLTRRLTKDGDKFIAIVAGYRKEMNEWMAKNKGLNRRFKEHIHLEDYNSDELEDIFYYAIGKEGIFIDSNGRLAVSNLMKYVVKHKPDDFGNAGWVNTIISKLDLIRVDRISKSHQLSNLSEQQRHTITFEDFLMLEKKYTYGWNPSMNTEQVEGDCMQRLNRMVGLSSVKKKIKSIKSAMEYTKRHPGKKNKKQAMHFCFYGNPGTGKTTVAKLLGEILSEFGVCQTNKVVCCDRSSLVAEFQGQTAQKTNAVIESAFGGILFIDEIYLLAIDERDTFGKEARDTLLKRMEDDRDKFTVILAGYKEETEYFLSKNPGFKSRITDYIEFEDYTSAELHQIMINLITDEEFLLNDVGDSKAIDFINETCQKRDSHFGNARWVRTFVGKIIEFMKSRVVENNIEGEMSVVITEDDIEMAIKEMN